VVISLGQRGDVTIPLWEQGSVAISLRAEQMRVLSCWCLLLLANCLSKSCNERRTREIGGVSCASCTSGWVVESRDS
jgi:hypothetical protein